MKLNMWVAVWRSHKPLATVEGFWTRIDWEAAPNRMCLKPELFPAEQPGQTCVVSPYGVTVWYRVTSLESRVEAHSTDTCHGTLSCPSTPTKAPETPRSGGWTKVWNARLFTTYKILQRHNNLRKTKTSKSCHCHVSCKYNKNTYRLHCARLWDFRNCSLICGRVSLKKQPFSELQLGIMTEFLELSDMALIILLLPCTTNLWNMVFLT